MQERFDSYRFSAKLWILTVLFLPIVILLVDKNFRQKDNVTSYIPFGWLAGFIISIPTEVFLLILLLFINKRFEYAWQVKLVCATVAIIGAIAAFEITGFLPLLRFWCIPVIILLTIVLRVGERPNADLPDQELNE